MTAMRQLFGTDGVRGLANVEPMTPETVLRLGQALAQVLVQRRDTAGDRPRIVIGRDTEHGRPGAHAAKI